MAISAVDLQAEINALRSMEANLNKVHAARQKYMSQHNENKLVLAELKMLKEGATVFKMMGPALVKQDQDEAVANVSKRLEWIESELDKVGSKEKEITKGLETQSRKVQKMQAEAQAAATAPAE